MTMTKTKTMTKKQVAACVKVAVEMAMKKVTAEATAGKKVTAATTAAKKVTAATAGNKVTVAAATGKVVKKAGRVAAAATGKVAVNKAGKVVVVVKNGGKVKPAKVWVPKPWEDLMADLTESETETLRKFLETTCFHPVRVCTCPRRKPDGAVYKLSAPLLQKWNKFLNCITAAQTRKLCDVMDWCCLTPNCDCRRGRDSDSSSFDSDSVSNSDFDSDSVSDSDSDSD